MEHDEQSCPSCSIDTGMQGQHHRVDRQQELESKYSYHSPHLSFASFGFILVGMECSLSGIWWQQDCGLKRRLTCISTFWRWRLSLYPSQPFRNVWYGWDTAMLVVYLNKQGEILSLFLLPVDTAGPTQVENHFLELVAKFILGGACYGRPRMMVDLFDKGVFWRDTFEGIKELSSL